MTVVSLKTEKPRSDGVFKIKFSDGSSLLLTTDYLPETVLPDGEKNLHLWELDRELSAGEEEAFRFAAACYRAEKISLGLVARAEQNSLGLTAKLERRGFDSRVVKAVVSRLLERNLLNDSRYAELWIRSRLAMKKAPSPQWLLIALGRRGIDRSSSLKALGKVLDPETEYALLLKYLEKILFPEGKEVFSLRTQLKHEGFSSDALKRYFDD